LGGLPKRWEQIAREGGGDNRPFLTLPKAPEEDGIAFLQLPHLNCLNNLKSSIELKMVHKTGLTTNCFIGNTIIMLYLIQVLNVLDTYYTYSFKKIADDLVYHEPLSISG